MLPGVQYLTGQRFDLRAIARGARSAGCRVGFDLAHAIGNVPLALHDCGADFAVWCNYKYLNAGPGRRRRRFVHERHARDFDLPRLAGWWGHDKATRFQMGPEFNRCRAPRAGSSAIRRSWRWRRCIASLEHVRRGRACRRCGASRCADRLPRVLARARARAAR